MRTIAFGTVLLSLSCGGGGGGGPPGGGNQQGAALAQQILETCGAPSLDEFDALVEAFLALFDPAAPLPEFTVNGPVGGAPATGLVFILDADGDLVPDVAGQFEFFDAGGTPAAPFPLEPYFGGLVGFGNELAAVPAGTELRVTFAAVSGSGGAGNLTFVFGPGAPATASGHVAAQVGCSAIFDFDGVAIVAGAIPAAEVDATMQSAEGSVAGTVTFDGTDVVTVAVTVNGGSQVFRFTVNLATGVVTPLP